MAQKTNVVILICIFASALTFSLAIEVDHSAPNDDTPFVDDITLLFDRQCRIACAKVNSKRRNISQAENNDPVSKIIGSYRSFPTCMNDCLCASYCDIFQIAGGISIEHCIPACRNANPYGDLDEFFAKFSVILYEAL